MTEPKCAGHWQFVMPRSPLNALLIFGALLVTRRSDMNFRWMLGELLNVAYAPITQESNCPDGGMPGHFLMKVNIRCVVLAMRIVEMATVKVYYLPLRV